MKRSSFAGALAGKFINHINFRACFFILVAAGLLISGIHLVISRSVYASGTITGTVYVDYNMNGTMDTSGTSPNYAIDSGVQNVTVTAYDASGASRGTATTASNGTYSLAATGTGPYRIEFTSLPAGYFPSATGTNNASTVRFIPDGSSSGIDLGIIKPSFYSQNNPLVTTSCYINGDNTGADDVLVALKYDRTGSVQHIGLASQIGSTWGLAYQRKTKKLFAAAMLKRHSAFGPGKDGTRGNADDVSSIYVIDYNTPGVTGTGTVVTGQTIELGSLGVSVGANPRVGSVPANDLSGISTTTPSHDYGVFSNVGKRGIGGIALSEDENTLYVVNLNSSQPQLVTLNVSNLNSVTLSSTVNIPNPGCPGSDSSAPWAVKVNNGNVYIGTVCTADVSQNAQNLRAYVLQLSGGSFTTVDLDSTSANSYISLYYDRTCGYYAIGAGRCGRAEWVPWMSSFPTTIDNAANDHTLASPILSDLEFETSGAIILGLMDRTGHQVGYENYSDSAADTTIYDDISAGDLIKVCNISGSYVPEGQAGCTRSITPAYDAVIDPAPGAAGTPLEFYDDNSPASTNDGHGEIFWGGLGLIPGSNELVTTVMNPDPATAAYNAGGWRWFSQTSGATLAGFTLFDNGSNSATRPTFGKANGLGDVVLLSDPAPLQLGNRIWTDTNANGIQDPGENGIQNVTVELWGDTNSDSTVDTKVGSATTDASGNYYFGGASKTNMLSSCGTNTLNIRVSASSDDASENAGTVTLTGTQIQLTSPRAAGLRFNSLTIPVGARITSAAIQFTSDTTISTNTVSVLIQGEATANSTTFTTVASNITGRSRTSSSVNWSTIGAWTIATADSNSRTPDLTSIVQEIVNTQGWASGNSLNFIITDSGSTSNRRIRSFDNVAATAPLLTVTYECPYSVNPNTNYEIRIPNASGGSKQAALGANNLTTANADPGANGDARDSDATLSTTTAVIALTTGNYGQNNHTYDFGFTTATPAYSVGNRVWYDTNNDGIMDVTEVGITGITVDLLDNSNAQVQTTTTDASGYYRFDGIVAGNYKVRIRASNFTGGSLKSYQSSTSNTSATDQRDNGVDPAGNNPSTAGVLSSTFTLGAAAQPLAEPDFTSAGASAHGTNGDVSDNLTVDFGFYSLTLGNLVYDDVNLNGTFDAGDVGIRTALVALYQSDGITIVPVGPDGILGTADDTILPASQFVTVAGGAYLFQGLPPGSYIVKVTPPAGYKSTADLASSANPNNGTDNDDNGIR